MAAFIIYIAAAAVIGLLIGFVALSIGWLRKTVLRNIRSKTIGLLSVYDDLLSRRSRELAEAEDILREKREEIAELEPPPETEESARSSSAAPTSYVMGMVERSGAAAYRDDAAGDMYRVIRKNFSFRVEDILPTLQCAGDCSGPAGRLLAELDFDTVYDLSTLSAEDQLTVLWDVLPDEGRDLVEDFLKSRPAFSTLEFYDYLRARADTEPKPVCLHVPEDMAETAPLQTGVRVVPDGEICEGFQLEENNLLYDYSIRSRELS